MAIYKDSRYQYANVDYVKVDEASPKQPVLFYYFDDIGTIKYTEYQWKEGDRIDKVAFNLLANSNAWWIIAEHNPEYPDPLNIPAGAVLRIPHA